MSDFLLILLTLALVLGLVLLVDLVDRQPLDDPGHDDGSPS